MSETDIFAMLSLSAEFENVAVREEELTTLMRKFCAHSVRAGVENRHGKVNVLLQTYIGRGRPSSFSLCADLNYIAQNAGRVVCSVFEIVQRRGWSSLCIRMLDIATAIERRLWPHECPFAQLNVSRDAAAPIVCQGNEFVTRDDAEARLEETELESAQGHGRRRGWCDSTSSICWRKGASHPQRISGHFAGRGHPADHTDGAAGIADCGDALRLGQ